MHLKLQCRLKEKKDYMHAARTDTSVLKKFEKSIPTMVTSIMSEFIDVNRKISPDENNLIQKGFY